MPKIRWFIGSIISIVATLSFSASALDQTTCIDHVVENVQNVCHSPSKKEQYWDVAFGAGGQADVKLKRLGKLGVDANARFTMGEWEGVQRVLKGHQASDNADYRACARALVPLFQKATCQQKEATPKSSANSSSSRVPSKDVAGKDDLSITYARLFGAYQVPFYLLDDSGRFIKGLAPTAIGDGPGGRHEKFLKSWEYRNAKAIFNPVWQEFLQASDDLECNALLLKANKDDPVGNWYAKYCDDEKRDDVISSYLSTHYKKQWDSSQFEGLSVGGTIEYYIEAKGERKSKAREIMRRIERNSRNVGFLILYVDNVSGRTLFDLQVQTKTLQRDKAESGESTELIERILAELPVETSHIPIIKPGEKVFFLLSIYRSALDGYPQSYLSSVVRPIQISYRRQGSNIRHELSVREPLRDRGARFYLPFGWYGQ